MATLQRQSILRGPGIVSMNGNVFYPKGDFDAGLLIKKFDVPNNVHGVTDVRRDDITGSVVFTPAGELENLTTLYPYQNPDIGAEIFTNSDVPCFVHSKAGTKVLYHAAAVTKMPDLFLSANKTLFGECEIMAVVKDNTARTSANSLYTISSTAFSDTSYSTAAVKTELFAAAWGSIFASIITEEGWQLSFGVQLAPVILDDIGTVGMTLVGVTCSAKCRPINLTEANIWDAMKAQSTGSARGSSLRQGSNLVIQSTSLTATIHDPALLVGPLQYGSSRLRAGEIAFEANRTESSGTFGNLFTLA